MITKISKDTREQYKILFAELSTLLMGYVETNTYTVPTDDNPAVTYYYRADESTGANYEFEEDTSITNLATFSDALAKHTLYIKTTKKDSNTGWTGKELGFIDDSTDLSNFQGITTIEEYLSWLAQLKALNEDYVLRFSRVPLTEECFKIDANTRAITIPTDFRKNGVGVQGDDVAEVVYFIIDRFYDVVDLNNCEVYIKWETPKNKNKGVWHVLYKDIRTEPGSIIFEWPITAAVASENGSLKFSVQFVQKDENDAVTYSFNTLTANVSIQTGLGFNISETDKYTVDEIGSRLVNRIQFSEIVGGAKAATPEFVLEPEVKVEGYDLTDETQSIDLTALATSSDTGAISYTWKRIDLDENNNIKTDSAGNMLSGEVVESTVVPVKRTIDELEIGRVYYWYDNADLIGNGTRYVVPATGISEELSLKTFAEMVSTCTVSADKQPVVGAYYVSATNRITNSVAPLTSEKKAIFLGPLKPELQSIEATNDGFFVDDADVELTVTASHIAEKEKQEYQWLYKAHKEDAFEEIEGAKQDKYIVSKSEGGKGSGYYTVEVKNSRNTVSISTSGEELGEIGSNKYIVRVTSEPIAITWSKKTPEVIKEGDITETSSFTAQLTNIDDVEFDTVSVAWYIYEPNIDGKTINEKIVDFTLINDPIENKEVSLTFTSEIQAKIKEITNGDLVAWYYPVIVNSINGREAPAEKDYNPGDTDKMFRIDPTVVEEELDVEALSLEDEPAILANEDASGRVTLEKLFFEE